MAAGRVGGLPVGLQIVGKVLTSILELVLIQDHIKQLLQRQTLPMTHSHRPGTPQRKGLAPLGMCTGAPALSFSNRLNVLLSPIVSVCLRSVLTTLDV